VDAATNRKWLLGICRFVLIAYSAASVCLLSMSYQPDPTCPCPLFHLSIHSYMNSGNFGMGCVMLLVLVRAGRGSRSAVVCTTKDGWCLFCWIRAPGHGMIEPKAISGTGQVRFAVHDNRNKVLKPCNLLFRSITFFVHLWLRTNKCRHFRHCTLRTNTFRDFRLYFFLRN